SGLRDTGRYLPLEERGGRLGRPRRPGWTSGYAGSRRADRAGRLRALHLNRHKAVEAVQMQHSVERRSAGGAEPGAEAAVQHQPGDEAVPGLTGVVAGGAGEVALPLVVAHQPADGVDVGDAAPRADVLEGTGELAHARGGGRVPTRGGAHHEGGDAQTLEAVEDLGEVQA